MHIWWSASSWHSEADQLMSIGCRLCARMGPILCTHVGSTFPCRRVPNRQDCERAGGRAARIQGGGSQLSPCGTRRFKNGASHGTSLFEVFLFRQWEAEGGPAACGHMGRKRGRVAGRRLECHPSAAALLIIHCRRATPPRTPSTRGASTERRTVKRCTAPRRSGLNS